jgi:hypothetical protein
MTDLPRSRILIATPPFSHDPAAVGPVLTAHGAAQLLGDLTRAGYRDITEIPHQSAGEWRRQLAREPEPS